MERILVINNRIPSNWETFVDDDGTIHMQQNYVEVWSMSDPSPDHDDVYIEEEWNEDDFKTSIRDCEHCGKTRPVQYLADPFLSEIHQREEYNDYCRECFRQRANEI
ncbi:hypothetical protein TA3x_004252 [Tundrisphaera sp. TA3]|uniref:hypothetical protein n=1 Tax=Tundrisphaera sp. TA3 TaxID=3435775 RepID=UPI003EBE5E0D